jgi:metal-responsive CopG/Arc/MetJ family transcriptional regulator
MRVHVVIPSELVEEVDALVGRRQRSRFITEAIEHVLAHERLKRAAEAVAGSLADVDIPGWESSEAAEKWVRSLREEWDQRLDPSWIPAQESA